MLVSLTVGKVDAGVAVLLTQDKRLIEFPSILLPPSITSGSIVDITVSQNHAAEQKAAAVFDRLQSEIVDRYGLNSPATPELRLRNATQTSIVLEWDPIDLQTSTLRSLSLYRNGQKAGNIPRPFDMHSTKISGLQLETEYSFYLVLRTSGGTYTSNVLRVKTQSMTDLTGITVTPGVLPPPLRESLEAAVERIGARIADSIRIDTTHFVCTEGRGRDWERANEMNIPVVRPEWIEGCEREGKLIGVRGYYLDANPKHRKIGSNPKLEKVTSAGGGGGGGGGGATPAGTAGAGATSPPPVDPRQNISMASPASEAALAAAAAASLAAAVDKTEEKEKEDDDDDHDEKDESEVEGEPGPEITGTPNVGSHPKQQQQQQHISHEDEDGDDSSEDETPLPPDPEKHNGDVATTTTPTTTAHANANGKKVEAKDQDNSEDEDEDEDEDSKEKKKQEDTTTTTAGAKSKTKDKPDAAAAAAGGEEMEDVAL